LIHFDLIFLKQKPVWLGFFGLAWFFHFDSVFFQFDLLFQFCSVFSVCLDLTQFFFQFRFGSVFSVSSL
jgi:hypothetical protein